MSLALLAVGPVDVSFAQPAPGMMDKKADPPNPAKIALDEFEKRIKAGEASKVIDDCNAVIAATPEAAFIAYTARGLAHLSKRSIDDAEKDFKEAVKLQGREPAELYTRAVAYTGLSECSFEKAQFIDAVDNAYYALIEVPEHAKAHARRSLAYSGWNRLDKAVYTANRAIAADDKCAEGYSARGVAVGLQGDYAKSIEDQTKAISIDKDNANYYERRGLAYIATKDAEKAIQDINEALKLDPNHSDALCDRAMIYGFMGKMGEAFAELDLAIKKNPYSIRAHYQKALAYQHQKMLDEAIGAASGAIRINGTFTKALVLRGNLFTDKKDFESAIEDYTAVLAIEKDSVDALTGRANAYRRLGKQDLAKADNTRLKEVQPAPVSKSASKKKEEEAIPLFKVTSTGVDPKRRATALEAAKKVDEFVAANYEKYKVEPNPLTTDAQFVRRIYLDITGRIPSYQQTVKFLTSKDADKRAALIDELLGSEGYASHSFNYWADVLRYTDHITQDVRGEPYRQWIKQSLAENKPWDKMVYEMITAEGLIWENPATGYMQRDAYMPLDNMNNTVRIFLGTRIGCAQCHNHPFDRWTQKEFYQMAAFTIGTSPNAGGGDKRYWAQNPSNRLEEEYAEIIQEEEDRRNQHYEFERLMSVNMRVLNTDPNRKINLPGDYAYDDAKPGDVVEPATLFGSAAEIRPGETPRQAFARWLTEKENPRFARTLANRLWQRAFGIGQIEPVDDMTDHTVAENPELMVFLETQLKDLNFDMKEYLRILFNSQTYQRQACAEEIPIGSPYHFQGPALRRMSAEQVWDSFLTLALENPEEFRELPADLRTTAIGHDLTTVSAVELLDSNRKAAEVDGMRYKLESKYRYQDVILARASELPSPLPANHFIRVFGQSDRELISSSSTQGSVPQVLFMFNGPISHMLLEKNSAIYNIVMKKRTANEGIKAVFLTVLNREPDAEDLALGALEVKFNGPAGYGNVIWALVNTREFLFIQ